MCVCVPSLKLGAFPSVCLRVCVHTYGHTSPGSMYIQIQEQTCSSSITFRISANSSSSRVTPSPKIWSGWSPSRPAYETWNFYMIAVFNITLLTTRWHDLIHYHVCHILEETYILAHTRRDHWVWRRRPWPHPVSVSSWWCFCRPFRQSWCTRSVTYYRIVLPLRQYWGKLGLEWLSWYMCL